MDIKNSELTPFSGEFYIVLDTNILINVHKKVFYSLPVLKSIFDANEDRLWIPKHVWTEYTENWSGIPKQCKKALDESQVRINQNIDKFKIRNAAGLVESQAQTKIELKFNPIREEIKRFYSNEKKKYSETQNTKIYDEMKDWLGVKVGNGFKIHEIIKIMWEGEVRYKNIIPPGYEDESKKNGNVFGDLIIWKEILDKAKKTNADIVFVTEDLKGDWDNPKSRKLLNQEFNEETGKDIQVLKLEDYQNVYSQKPATKRISEALAQLDENRERYSKFRNELTKSILSELIRNMLEQKDLFTAAISTLGFSNDPTKIFFDNPSLKSLIDSASDLDRIKEMAAIYLPSIPYTANDLLRMKGFLDNSDIDDKSSTDHR